MLDDPTVGIIFCGRGGYGTSRILDQLNFDEFKKRPKWIVGFSDITALHLKLHQLGVESIHGCMPTQYSKPEYESSISRLRDLILGNSNIKVEAAGNGSNKSGIVTGKVIGGNLSLIVDSLGTATTPDANGKILIVEEIDEYLYKIDRMFTQLKRSGVLSNLAGLAIGHMTDLKDTELPFNQSVEELILDKVAAFSYPVGFNFPIGHQSPNFPWVHSASATLNVTADGSLLSFD
jgi:muramoyltetrapeptide carboxypeptidase